MSQTDMDIDPGMDNPAFTDSENIENGKQAKFHEEEENIKDETLPGNPVSRKIAVVQKSLDGFVKKNREHFCNAVKIIILIAYLCYFGYAMYYRFGDEGSIRLLVVTILVLLGIIIYILHKRFSDRISEIMNNSFRCNADESKQKKINTILWIVLGLLIFVAILIYIIVETGMKQPYNLISLLGLFMYIFLCFITSYSPAHVRWRPVVGGLLLQFIFALLILKTVAGYEMFKWLGDRVAEFLKHADAGSQFLFGGLWDKCFAFSVLPVIIFFSAAISVSYYLGFMQVIILKLAYVMQIVMGTTAAESVNAAANIFIGQSEAPLVIRPLIKDMTRSELHAVMTGGFATIAGTVLAAYISFGVPANHLLGASVMSAPAALAIAKLFYPETERSKTSAKNVGNLLEKSPEKNIFEAASNGASTSAKLVANIAVNLVAFLAVLQFVDQTLEWVGQRVGVEDLTFGLICSYIFFPLAWMMGVAPVNCRKVAELLGVKTFLNEFIAYDKLGILINNKVLLRDHLAINGTYIINSAGDYQLNDNKTTILAGGVLEDRSEVIATYALCGFANFGSMGIMLAALGVMAPNKKSDLSKIVMRAMIAGNVACFMTACIAGLLYEPSIK